MTASSNTPAKPQKFMEPNINFVRKRIKVEVNGNIEKVTVTDLVKKGDVLLDFPDFERFSAKGFVKSPVQSGENTEFSENEEQLIAAVTGYPCIDLMKPEDGGETILHISVKALVRISNDKMTATMCLQPPMPGAPSLEKRGLALLIKEAGVISSVNQDVVQEVRKFIRAGNKEAAEFVIAKGKLPTKGFDARIVYALEIGPLAGRIMNDGRIDFRERKVMVPVEKDQLLATKIPAEKGYPGGNVIGEELEAEMGTDIKIKVSNDAVYLEEEGEARATKDGVLSVVNDNVLKVCSHQKITGDIDFSTGNIESKNAVSVSGSLQPGFKVIAGGDVEIGGGVRSATVACEGNVVIKAGVTGKNSSVQALGDADIKFVEQGTVDAGGLVVIRKQAYYSEISATGTIRGRDSSTVMGGRLISGRSMSLGSVGSENCEPTLLGAGIDKDRLHKYEELQKSVVEQQDAIIKWLQVYGGSAKSKKVRNMEQGVKDTKLQLLQLNLIPGTGEFSRAGGAEISGAEEEEIGLYDQEEGIDIQEITIDVSGEIFAGTKVRIGNRNTVLDVNLENKRFKLFRNGKRIVVESLSKSKRKGKGRKR